MRSGERGPERLSSEERIRFSATQIIRESGFDRMTVAEVARQSGVNEVTVYRIFGSRDGLAAACWSENVEMLDRGILSDRSRFKTETDRIGSHLRRLARISADNREITYAMIQAVQSATIRAGTGMGELDPRTIVPLTAICAPLVEAGQASGTIRDDYPASELAAILTNTLLLRLMTRPSDSAASVANYVIDLLFQGLLVRRDEVSTT